MPIRRWSPSRRELLRAGGASIAALLVGSCGAALLDVWQSDDRGDEPAVYSDNATWWLRGRLYTAEGGSYDLRTIVPGRYLNDASFRPAHIHARVSAPGHRLLTTQLYFDGDPYNDADPYIDESLVMTLADADGGKAAQFDFVIPVA